MSNPSSVHSVQSAMARCSIQCCLVSKSSIARFHFSRVLYASTGKDGDGIRDGFHICVPDVYSTTAGQLLRHIGKLKFDFSRPNRHGSDDLGPPNGRHLS
jgi:hypothetical protein